MLGINDNNAWSDTENRWRWLGLDGPRWALVALGAVLALTATRMVVVQPTVRQLAQLQDEIAALESGMRDLVDQRGTVTAANTLLAQLAEQGRRNDEASQSLNRIAMLHERLNQQTERAERALAVMEKLATLQDALVENATRVDAANDTMVSIEALHERLNAAHQTCPEARKNLDALIELERTALAQTPHVEAARQTLESLVDIKNWLLWSGEGLARSQDVTRSWLAMGRGLAQAAGQAADARQAADALMSLSDDLVCRGGNAAPAQEALDNLVAIRERLDDQGTGVQLARDRVEQLIDLKDRTLAQTGNLPSAIENLELLADVQEQLSHIAQSFGRMRQLVTELLTFEPAFNRAMRALQPLAELSNLRRLSTTDLRQIVRSMSEPRGQVPTSPTTEPPRGVELPTAAPIVEASRTE